MVAPPSLPADLIKQLCSAFCVHALGSPEGFAAKFSVAFSLINVSLILFLFFLV